MRLSSSSSSSGKKVCELRAYWRCESLVKGSRRVESLCVFVFNRGVRGLCMFCIIRFAPWRFFSCLYDDTSQQTCHAASCREEHEG